MPGCAPKPSSCCTAAAWPDWAAKTSGVAPVVVACRLTLALAPASIWMSVPWPPLAARCSAALPCWSGWSIGSPACRHACAPAMSPLPAARWSRVVAMLAATAGGSGGGAHVFVLPEVRELTQDTQPYHSTLEGLRRGRGVEQVVFEGQTPSEHPTRGSFFVSVAAAPSQLAAKGRKGLLACLCRRCCSSHRRACHQCRDRPLQHPCASRV
jgi:hypothetical protein